MDRAPGRTARRQSKPAPRTCFPRKQAAGSDNPDAQAEAILEESEARTLDPVAEEHRTSEDTVDPTP